MIVLLLVLPRLPGWIRTAGAVKGHDATRAAACVDAAAPIVTIEGISGRPGNARILRTIVSTVLRNRRGAWEYWAEADVAAVSVGHVSLPTACIGRGLKWGWRWELALGDGRGAGNAHLLWTAYDPRSFVGIWLSNIHCAAPDLSPAGRGGRPCAPNPRHWGGWGGVINRDRRPCDTRTDLLPGRLS